MKNLFKKKTISLIILSVVLVGGIFANTSIALTAGSISSLFFYDQNGILINNIASSSISVNNTLILKSTNNKSVFTYKYGKIVLDKDSILIIKENNLNFIFYLVDGTAEITSKSISSNKVRVITPVTSYTFDGDSDGDINVISTDKQEAFELFSGTTTVFNSITGKTYKVHENNKMDLNSPELIAINKLEQKNSRKDFIDKIFPLNIKPISKSDDHVDQYVLNILATGNGQGNVNLLNFATFKGILDEADKKNEKYLLIDAGNTLSGSVYVNQDKGETASQLLEKVGYDVFVPGSYDFAYGYKHLQELDKNSKVTFISSNSLTNDNYNILTPYQLYAFNDLRIAVIGLSNPSELTNLDNLKFNSDIIIDNAQFTIDVARQYVDLVILVTNYSDEYINSRSIAKNINGIDLIIDGARSIAGTYKERDTYIVSTGVGYNKVIDTKISVYKDNILSINPVIIHSSNIALDTKNQLASSLGVYNYNDNDDMVEFISKISIQDGLSSYLIAPNETNMSSKSKANVPKVPIFSKFEVRKDKPSESSISTDDINSSNATPEIKAKTPEITNLTQTKVKETFNKIGITTTLEANTKVEDFDYKDYEIMTTASIVPYFKSKNLTLALYFELEIQDILDNDDRKFENSFTTSPDDNWQDMLKYSINFIDELSFSLNDNMINFELKKGVFDSPIKSALVYRKLGSDDLALNLNIELNESNTQIFLTDPSLDSYYNTDKNFEQAGIIETIKLKDYNLVLQAAYLASGQNGIINSFPIISSTYTFLDKPNYNLELNINGSTLIELKPSINFDTISENYIIGSSLIINSQNNKLELGVNYLATEDVFNANLLHQRFNRNNVFDNLDDNTIIPFVSIDSEFNNIKTHLGYSLPRDLSDNVYEKDIIDFTFDYASDKFTTGLFYVHSNLLSDIDDFSTIKNFLYSDNIECGINASWNINDFISSALETGVTSNIANPLYLNLSLTLDLNKEL